MKFSRTKKRLAAAAVAVVAMGGAAATAAPAQADRGQLDVSGNTIVKLGSQLARTLQSNGCGFLEAVDTTGGATAAFPKDGRVLKLTFPVTNAVDSGANGIRINHDGGLELANSCLDLKITNLVVQNFGDADQFMTLEVLAKTFANGDDLGRTQVFTLDLSGADFSTAKGNANNIKIRGMDLLLGQDGADAFNTLATGSPEGPLAVGEQVGKARTTLKFPGEISE